MSTALNLVAVGAVAAWLLGKVQLKTALIVGIGAVVLANVIPVTTTPTSQTS